MELITLAILSFLKPAMLTVAPLVNSSFGNSTDIVSFFQLVNNSPAINGLMSEGIVMALFIIMTIVFSYRIMIINAMLVASVITMFVTVLLNAIGLLGSGFVLLFVALTVVFALVSLVRGLLRPFS